MSNIYEKLFKMRESIKKEQFDTFSEFVDIVDKKAKYHKVLILYCFYDEMAVLTLVNVEEVTDTLKFQLPADGTSIQQIKEQLYYMAFDINENNTITAVQYVNLMKKIKEKKVNEREIIERYKISSIEEMTEDIYKRCKRALARM